MRYKTAIVLLSTIFISVSCEKESGNRESTELSGRLISNTACKSLKSANQLAGMTSNQSCLEYSYDAANKVLKLKHINAGFNCCPDSLYCYVTLSKDTILISEFEESALCNCCCLFDLDIEVTGVEMRHYQLKLVEPYVVNQDEIVFGMNLLINQEGSFCVNRTQYPWGI